MLFVIVLFDFVATIFYFYVMRKFLSPIYLFIIIIIATSAISCKDRGIGCEQDKYNDWKKIEANRKQQMKSPHDTGKGSSKKKVKTKVYGNGIVP